MKAALKRRVRDADSFPSVEDAHRCSSRDELADGPDVILELYPFVERHFYEWARIAHHARYSSLHFRVEQLPNNVVHGTQPQSGTGM